MNDDNGKPITTWDRRSLKTDPVTGREIPDESQRVPLLSFPNARPASWPKTDFIVGNPPFLGKGKLREAVGDGYAETLRTTYPEVPESADFVMYWWHKAAALVATGTTRRFGLITTNSLRQTFNRRVIQHHQDRVSIVFAIPDHPWGDTTDGAAVRIAMTVGIEGDHSGVVQTVISEEPLEDGSSKVTFSAQYGKIMPDLSIGADLSRMLPLKANDLLASTGLILGGRGFVVRETETREFVKRNARCKALLFPLRNGEDITGTCRNVWVIDTNGWSDTDLRREVPEIYQHLHQTVFPERQSNRDPKLRKQWWLFRRSNEQVRNAISGLDRYIATVETAKHRLFQFLSAGTMLEHRLIVIGVDDAFAIGVLSSRLHVTFALAAGGTLEDRPVYNKTRCFDPFPFPDCGESTKARIRALGGNWTRTGRRCRRRIRR